MTSSADRSVASARAEEARRRLLTLVEEMDSGGIEDELKRLFTVVERRLRDDPLSAATTALLSGFVIGFLPDSRRVLLDILAELIREASSGPRSAAGDDRPSDPASRG